MTELEWLNSLKTHINNEMKLEGNRCKNNRIALTKEQSDFDRGFKMGCNHTINELDIILHKIEKRIESVKEKKNG